MALWPPLHLRRTHQFTIDSKGTLSPFPQRPGALREPFEPDMGHSVYLLLA